MRNLKKLTTTLLLAGWTACLTAQNEQPADSLPAVWSLQSSIDYALQHNITLQKSRINAESADIDVKTARSSFLPTIQGSISQRIVNRPNSTSGTGTWGAWLITPTPPPPTRATASPWPWRWAPSCGT